MIQTCEDVAKDLIAKIAGLGYGETLEVITKWVEPYAEDAQQLAVEKEMVKRLTDDNRTLMDSIKMAVHLKLQYRHELKKLQSALNSIMKLEVASNYSTCVRTIAINALLPKGPENEIPNSSPPA